jgi:anti-sigma B factor antagonist
MSVRAGRATLGRDDFRIRRMRLDGSDVVEVAGGLDICSSHTLREKLAAAAVAGASPLVVDLSELSFIDSTGIGVLAMAARRLATKAGMTIVCPGGRVCRTLAQAGLDRVVPVYTTRNEALHSEAGA